MGLALALWFAATPSPVGVNGAKPVGEWLPDLIELDPDRRARAEAEVERRGAALVPVLRRMLSEHRRWWNKTAPRIRSSLPRSWQRWEGWSDDGHRPVLAALAAVRVLGPRASDATQEVRGLLLSLESDWATAAVDALAAMKKSWTEVEADFISTLERSPLAEVRARCAETMATAYAGECRSALPALTRALRDPYANVRVSAANAIGKLRRNGTAAGDALAMGLHDASAGVRIACLLALRRTEGVQPGMVPRLIELLRDSDSDVRLHASKALESAGPAAAPAVPELMRLLRDEHIPVQICAIEALGGIGPAAQVATAALREARNNNASGVGRQVLDALGRIEP